MPFLQTSHPTPCGSEATGRGASLTQVAEANVSPVCATAFPGGTCQATAVHHFGICGGPDMNIFTQGNIVISMSHCDLPDPTRGRSQASDGHGFDGVPGTSPAKTPYLLGPVPQGCPSSMRSRSEAGDAFQQVLEDAHLVVEYPGISTTWAEKSITGVEKCASWGLPSICHVSGENPYTGHFCG